MSKIRLLSLNLIGLGVLLFSVSRFLLPSTQAISISSTAVPTPTPKLKYKSYILPHSVVHTLLIPSQSQLHIASSQGLEPIEKFAQKYGAMPDGKTRNVYAVLNGGFFDPKNQKTTSYVIQQGKLREDPRQNDRLMKNPDLAPYLDKILNRTELRRYSCSQSFRYDLALHSEPPLPDCQLVDALGGGPRLLPQLNLQQEGFVDVANGKVIRDALGSSQRNARTAIGITRDRNIIWVMVAQKPEDPTNSGMTLPELADFIQNLGVETAMNLDGGSSSALYYQGKTFYGKVDQGWVKRPIKSVLLVTQSKEK